jgi:hypothetical protein
MPDPTKRVLQKAQCFRGGQVSESCPAVPVRATSVDGVRSEEATARKLPQFLALTEADKLSGELSGRVRRQAADNIPPFRGVFVRQSVPGGIR